MPTLDLEPCELASGQDRFRPDDSVLWRLLETRGLTGASPEPAAGRRPARAGASPSILVVDDDADVLAVLHDVLELSGARVVTATDGETALAAFARDDFDLLVTDLALPGLNGLQLAARCRRLKPSLPVIMVTAWETLLADEDLGVHGVQVVLAKPVRTAALLAAVQDLLGRG